MRIPKLMKLFVILGVAGAISGLSINLNHLNRLKYSAILNNNNNPGKGTKGLLNKYILNDEFSTNVFKQQVLYELKSSEEVLKNLLFKILNHLYEYVRYRLISSFYNFYIVNPFNFKLTNLLNTQLNNYYLTNKLNLPTYATPALYGLNYESVAIENNNNSWFIKSNNKNADSAFVLMHGWFGNLQSTLPFLNILNQNGVLDKHHVLILNANPGDENNFLANIGLAGVVNLYHGMEFLHKNFNVKKFTLYGQSINSVSILMLTSYMEGLKSRKGGFRLEEPEGRPEGESQGRGDRYWVAKRSEGEQESSAENAEEMLLFRTLFKHFDRELLGRLTVEKVVLDSPVVSVANYVRHYSQFLMMLNTSLTGLNVKINWDKYLNMLNIFNYLRTPQVRRKVFMLQGVHDSIATVEMLRNELKNNNFLPHIYLFNNSGHIDASVGDYAEYKKAVEHVLGYGGLWSFLRFNRSKVKTLKQLE